MDILFIFLKKKIAKRLYDIIVKQARAETFYRELGIPDNPEGRYEVIVLHVFVILRALKSAESRKNKKIAQALFDNFFYDIEKNYREMGVSDQSMGNRVKKLANNVYSKLIIYDKAIEKGGSQKLASILRADIYSNIKEPPRASEKLAQYVLDQIKILNLENPTDLLTGVVSFSPIHDNIGK